MGAGANILLLRIHHRSIRSATRLTRRRHVRDRGRRARVKADRAVIESGEHCVEAHHHGGHFMPLELEGGKESAESSPDPAKSRHEGRLTEPEAIVRYRNIVRARMGITTAAARQLGVHWNTVACFLDHDLLARWKARRSPPRPDPPTPRGRRRRSRPTSR